VTNFIFYAILKKVQQMIARQLEESPGCYKTRFHLTDGWGNPRDSATESKLYGKGETAG